MDLTEQVNDIEWSPDTSSVFAMVADDGRIEIWDLKKDNLEPQLCFWDDDEDRKVKTVVRWNNACPVLVTGNDQGTVDVYRHKGLEHIQMSDEAQIERLVSALETEDFAGAKKKEDSG